MREVTVAIIGLGPTGMTVANELQKHGINYVIVDKRKAISEMTRAVNLTPASLSLLEFSLGLDVSKKTTETNAINAYWLGKPISRVSYKFQKFPHRKFCYLPQPLLEKQLFSKLDADNADVIEEAELIGVEKNNEGYVLKINSRLSGESTINAQYIVACDGNNSFVRQWLNIENDTEDYNSNFFLYDIKTEEKIVDDSSYFLFEHGYVIVVPIAVNNYRIILSSTKLSDKNTEKYNNINFLSSFLQEQCSLKLTITDLIWFTQAAFKHRIAQQCQQQKIFLAGDAFHVFSPVGGLNLNTGLQDAINLAWKLAYVIKGFASSRFLVSYTDERMRVIEAIKNKTKYLTQVMTQAENYPAAKKYIISLANRNFLKHELPQLLSGYDSYQSKINTSGQVGFSPGHHISEFISNKSIYSDLCKKIDPTKFNLLINDDVSIDPEIRDLVARINVKQIDLNGHFILLRPDGYIFNSGLLNQADSLRDCLSNYLEGNVYA